MLSASQSSLFGERQAAKKTPRKADNEVPTATRPSENRKPKIKVPKSEPMALRKYVRGGQCYRIGE